MNKAIQEARLDFATNSSLPFLDQDESLISYAISISAQEVISRIGINMLSDEFLENRWEVSEGTGVGIDNPAKFGNDDSAEEQKANILALVDALLDETREDVGSFSGKQLAEAVGKSAAKKLSSSREMMVQIKMVNFKVIVLMRSIIGLKIELQGLCWSGRFPAPASQ